MQESHGVSCGSPGLPSNPISPALSCSSGAGDEQNWLSFCFVVLFCRFVPECCTDSEELVQSTAKIISTGLKWQDKGNTHCRVVRFKGLTQFLSSIVIVEEWSFISAKYQVFNSQDVLKTNSS